MRTLILAFALLASPVQAADLYVTYYAAPEGATLIQDGAQTMGTTPLRIKYPVPRRWKGCMTLRPMTVKWISGAEASITGLEACAENGKEQQFYFARPTGVDGLQIDVQYAGQLQQLALMQQQIALQQQAANQASWAALLQSIQTTQQNIYLQQQIRAAQRTLNCTSSRIGSTVYTNCY